MSYHNQLRNLENMSKISNFLLFKILKMNTSVTMQAILLRISVCELIPHKDSVSQDSD